GGESASTIHLGAGQSFAISKSMALRWDFSWNFYQPTAEVLVNNELVEKKSNHDDLYLSLGMSFFFPEATYR
ncbi:MAG: hypothetical protein KDD35_07825, partial [Bdellovibrionales bacterium]|nr:hypothetical protein [Bdellovibrionales bacterium]